MGSYVTMEIERLTAAKDALKQNGMNCAKCGSVYFTLKAYSPFRRDFPVSPGDAPPTMGVANTFYLLECICGELYEVQTDRMNAGQTGKRYDDFLDQVEKSVALRDKK